MNQKPELLNDDNPEWTAEDFARAVPFSGLPASLQSKLSVLPKESVTVQFDRDVLATFKATGNDWQTRINDALREWLSEHAV